MRHVSYNALAKWVPLFLGNLADKSKRALSLSNSSFFLSPYLVCLLIVGVQVIVARVHTQTQTDRHTHTHTHTHTNTHTQSVGIFWTSDRPVAETSTWQYTILTTDRHPCLRRNSNPNSELPQNHALDRAVTWIGLCNTKDKLKGITPLSEN
jgi:hypothetical protein